MIIRRFSLFLIIGLVLTLFALRFPQGEIWAASARPTSLPKPQVTRFGEYEITMTALPQQPELTEVVVRHLPDRQVELSLILANVYVSHYHNSEYHHDSLYLIRRVGYEGYPDNDWTDELWRYEAEGQGTRLYSNKGLDFRVAPDESYAAIDADSKLAFVDSQGKIGWEFPIEQLSHHGGEIFEYIDLQKWSTDNAIFWGYLSIGGQPQSLFKVSLESWQLQITDVTNLPMYWEDDLNPDTGQIVYSDHPSFITEPSAKKFIESGQTVSLFVYEGNIAQPRLIATSKAKPFKPEWRDGKTLEYDDPNGSGRLVYTLP
jgi:hypothetical protein